jgi:hypothetical protein
MGSVPDAAREACGTGDEFVRTAQALEAYVEALCGKPGMS